FVGQVTEAQQFGEKINAHHDGIFQPEDDFRGDAVHIAFHSHFHTVEESIDEGHDAVDVVHQEPDTRIDGLGSFDKCAYWIEQSDDVGQNLLYGFVQHRLLNLFKDLIHGVRQNTFDV